jgi:hypothetical protein
MLETMLAPVPKAENWMVPMTSPDATADGTARVPRAFRIVKVAATVFVEFWKMPMLASVSLLARIPLAALPYVSSVFAGSVHPIPILVPVSVIMELAIAEVPTHLTSAPVAPEEPIEPVTP